MRAQKSKTAILWFRNDLRLHDNESLTYAIDSFDNVIPIYVFDKRMYEGTTSYGFPKIDTFRTKFYIESVLALRQALRSKGSDLIIRYGITEDVLSEICQTFGAEFVLCNRERTTEEVNIQNMLEQSLWQKGAEILYFRGKMLYYTADLPFPIKHTPDTFSQFRKELYKIVPIRDPLPAPDRIRTYTGNVDTGEIPERVSILSNTDKYPDEVRVIGGEDEALKRLQDMERLLQRFNIDEYKSDSFEDFYTTHLSPWISKGSLSPKLLYKTLLPFAEAENTKYVVQKIINNLLYRDFCRFMAKKYEDRIFYKNGVKGETPRESFLDLTVAKRFIKGKTGIPIIDAQVRKLINTGYLTSKSRRILASFFIFDLKLPWLYGAEFFESHLIDYDPASNYANWGILADTYHETVGNAYINIVHQAEKFDPEGVFVKRWVPVLSKVDEGLIHYPWKWEPAQRKKWDLPESVYPFPIVSPRYSLV